MVVRLAVEIDILWLLTVAFVGDRDAITTSILRAETRRALNPDGVQVGGGQSSRLVAATARGQLQRRLVGLVSDRPRMTVLGCADRRITVRAFIDRVLSMSRFWFPPPYTRRCRNQRHRVQPPAKGRGERRATIGRAISAPFARLARCSPRSPSGLLRSFRARCHFCNHECDARSHASSK